MDFASRFRAVFLLLAAISLAAAADLPSRNELQQIFDDLGTITKLTPKKSVPLEQMTRKRLNAYLEERVRKSVKPKDLRADELTMKWLGLVPADFDLKKTTIDLLTEQAAAFYDYRKKKLVLMENPVGEFDRTVVAHELSHALADQYFKIGRYMDDAAKTDDAATARQAVVEGQASWLMTEWDLRQQKRGSLFENAKLLPGSSSFDNSGSLAYPVLEKAPLYLRVSLLFPYWEGGRFQQAVIEKKGAEAFREVFLHPPATTQQILHPEVYFEGRGADTPTLPKLKLKGWKPMTDGTLGELDHLVIFKMLDRPDAADLASAWRGAVYEVSQSKKECCVLRYISRWKDEQSAEKVQEAWSAHVARKAVRGKLQIHREGRDVIATEGAPE